MNYKNDDGLYQPDEHKPTAEEAALGQKVWDWFQLNHRLRESDIIICLGSNDTLPAETAAELFLSGWSKMPYVVCAGKGGRFTEQLKTTEARILADTMAQKGVPRENIILEENSTDTGKNFTYTKELLAQRDLYPKSMISVHMPSAERRDMGTANKVWPELDVIVASPRVPMRTYHERGFKGVPGQEFSPYRVISTLVGNVQRIMHYPKVGFMVAQPDGLPAEILEAYNALVYDHGYKKDMMKDKETGEIIRIP